MKAKRNFKHVCASLRWLSILLASTPCLAIETPEAATPQDTGWPRDASAAKAQMTLYQPQIDEWESYRVLHARLAVSLKPAGEAPVLGVAEISGETTVDKEKRTVLIRNIRVDDAHFISGQTRHDLPGYAEGTRPGEGGAGERNPAFDNRPGAGGSGTRNPNLPARHTTDPGEVQQRLNRDSYARDRGEARTHQFQQQRSFNQGGGGFNRSGGGFNRGGFGGGGGGFRRGGGGFHRR